jgi:hypothetical protein
MGLFSGRNKPPTAKPLSSKERRWLDQQRENFRALTKQAGREADDTLERGDRLIRWWHDQPPESRPDANDVLMAVAVALGDVLIDDLGSEFDWMIVKSPFGRDLAVWRERGFVVLSPTHAVNKRFDEPGGFVPDLFEGMKRSVEHFDSPQPN